MQILIQPSAFSLAILFEVVAVSLSKYLTQLIRIRTISSLKLNLNLSLKLNLNPHLHQHHCNNAQTKASKFQRYQNLCLLILCWPTKLIGSNSFQSSSKVDSKPVTKTTMVTLKTVYV